jgi:hypothetical protein
MYILSLIFFIVHSINKHQNIINSNFNSPVQKVFVGHFLRIFEEMQNPVDMHTSIMCINILQNIKAVAPKLLEEIAGQTMHLYPDGRTGKRTRVN